MMGEKVGARTAAYYFSTRWTYILYCDSMAHRHIPTTGPPRIEPPSPSPLFARFSPALFLIFNFRLVQVAKHDSITTRFTRTYYRWLNIILIVAVLLIVVGMAQATVAGIINAKVHMRYSVKLAVVMSGRTYIRWLFVVTRTSVPSFRVQSMLRYDSGQELAHHGSRDPLAPCRASSKTVVRFRTSRNKSGPQM